MKRVLLSLAVLTLALSVATVANAQSSTASIQVSANVTNPVSITATPLAFGVIEDPSVNTATAQGALVIKVPETTPYSVSLNAGYNFFNGTRNMWCSSGYLPYELCQDSGCTTVWGDDGATHPGSSLGGQIGTGNPQTITVYGQTATSTDSINSSACNDNVVAEVNL